MKKEANKSNCVVCEQIRKYKGVWFDHKHILEKDLNKYLENQEKDFKKVVKPKSVCYGITNKCDDGEYILFADYDKIYFHVLLKELRNIFDKFQAHVTNFAIFESTESISTKNGTLGSYHVVSFAKIPYHKMRAILSNMTIDDDFFALPKATAYRSNTLRISPKFKWFKDREDYSVVLKDEPKFITWFPEEEHYPLGKVSNAHIKAYKHYIDNFKMPLFTLKWSRDSLNKLEVKKYCSKGE